MSFENLLISVGKIAVIALCGYLNALGGKHWLFCRRYIMPSILAVTISLITGIWWMGLMVLPAMGSLTLPYADSGNFGRALWLFIQSVIIGNGLAIAYYDVHNLHVHYLSWQIYLLYVVLTGVLGGLYKNWQQFLGDWITGSWLTAIILFVK